MAFDKKEMLEELELEIEVIEKGGYNPSVREPHKALRIFRDSVTCLNAGLKEKKEPCLHCFLTEFVPAEYLNEEEPCHRIPLNEQGDTVASLESNRDNLEFVLLLWLRATVTRLEEEIAQEQSHDMKP